MEGPLRRPPALLAGVVALVAAVAGCRQEPPAASRVIVVGLDGATFDVLSPLMESGAAPRLREFMQRGVTATLEADLSQGLSPALWTTSVTGREAAVHGITDFMLPIPGSDQLVPAASGHRTAPALWNIVSDAGLEVGVVGLWATWPAEPVRGAIVSDHVTYSRLRLSKQFETRDGATVPFRYDTTQRNVHPQELLEKVTERVLLPSQMEPETFRRFADYRDVEIERVLAAGYTGDFNRWASPHQELMVTTQSDRSYAAIGTMLLEEIHPDLLIVYLEGIDVIEHRFWGPRTGTVGPIGERFRDVVDHYYSFTDELIGDYLALASPDTVILVYSDHGYRSRPDAGEGEPEHWHDSRGIFLAAGGPIRSGLRSNATVSLLDVTPTILYLMGLPVARDMPGRILSELIDEDHVARNPPRFVDSYGLRKLRPKDIASSEIDDDWKQRLESLGYVLD